MFAPRFDPNAVYEERPAVPRKLISRKRKIEAAEIQDSSDDSSSDSETEKAPKSKSLDAEIKSNGESSSSSSSSSESSSSDDSDSSDDSSSSESETDSETEVENEKSTPLESLPKDSNTDESSSGTQVADAGLSDKTPPKENTNSSDNEDDMEIDETGPGNSAESSKHASILKKFAKSTQNQDLSSSESDSEMEDAKDLAPMPQPELPRDFNLVSHQYHQKNLDWLASPTYALPEVTRPFSEFGLSARMLENLSSSGFKEAFSVQVSVLNEVMKDIRKNILAPDFQGDILVNASTGSGKTLAYSIPIVETLQTRIVPRIRAIILVPTKPLISQVASTLRSLASGTPLTVVSLTNDKSIQEEGARIVKSIPDIIVSTPGRLVDHLLNGSISMESLRFLVIDEADRLLNQSFQNWCEVVVSAIEKWERPEDHMASVWRLRPQKMIFSATLTTDAGKLSLLKFNKPRLIVVNSKEQLVNEMFSVPATLQEHKLRFSSNKSALKPLLLAKFLLHTNKLSSVLVFAKSNDATLRLTRILNDLFAELAPERKTNVAFINSTNNMSSARKKILRDFAANKINILVATDLIARGLDVLSITDVVNYDVPNSSREYVHRVGRTARANQNGEAFTFCFGNGESRWFNNIMVDVARLKPIIDIEEEPVSESEKTAYTKVMASFQESMKNEH